MHLTATLGPRVDEVTVHGPGGPVTVKLSLIRAAPDLFDALKDLATQVDENVHGDRVEVDLQDASDAIAKAQCYR